MVYTLFTQMPGTVLSNISYDFHLCAMSKIGLGSDP